ANGSKRSAGSSQAILPENWVARWRARLARPPAVADTNSVIVPGRRRRASPPPAAGDVARLLAGGSAPDGSRWSPPPRPLRDRSRGAAGKLLASDGWGRQAGPGPSTSISPPPETTRSSLRLA